MSKGNILYLDCGCYLTINIRQKSLNCIPKKKGELVSFTLCKLCLNKSNPENKTTQS